MTRRYEHKDAVHASTVLRSLLPDGVTCTATLAQEGWEMLVSVCGPEECRTHRMTVGLRTVDILTLAARWATGRYIEPASSVSPLPEVTAIESENDLREWARSARPGQRVVYFRGELSVFRFETPRRIIDLEALMDATSLRRKNKETKETAGQRAELRRLRTTTEILAAVDSLHRLGRIEMVQTRLSDGQGSIYLAVKR
jgi:hypothetical protein